MKTAFFHDCVFVIDEEERYYTKGGLDSKKLSEYVNYFGEMTVFTRARRIKDNDDKKKMTIASTENVNFKSVNNLNPISLFFGETKNKIKELVNKSDFIIIRMPSFIGHVAIKECKKQNKNYLVEMVACPWDALWNYGKLSKKICALPTFILNKNDLKNAKNVIYVSEEFLQRRYPTKGKNIGCSDVVLKDFDNNCLESRLKKIDKMNDKNKIKICTVAKVELKYTGQEYVIKAIKKLKKKGMLIDYYIVGGGDPTRLKKIIEKYELQDDVHLTGGIPHNKVYDLLDEIDLYIQPSLQEGLPRAVVEAMSRACPIIGSKTGGIPELISDEYIFKRKNVAEISKMIERFISSKNTLKGMAIKNYEKSKKFQSDILIDKRNNFYKMILADKA